jgi:septal ring factor EnvC (AmiA/AmiB activator)
VRQGDAKPKGLFDLHNVSVTTLPSAQFNTHCFAVVNAARMRLWILQATSAEEMHSWMEAIEPTKKFKETIEWEKKQTKAQIDQAYQEVKAHQEKIIALSKELDAIFEENQALKRQNAELLQAIQEINKTV